VNVVNEQCSLQYDLSTLSPENPANRQPIIPKKVPIMPNGLVDNRFEYHLFQCVFRKNHTSCKLVDLYLAITRLHARLEEELKEFKIKVPIGPDPSPEDTLRDMIKEGDPDGNPSLWFQVNGIGNIDGRIEVATKFHGALQKFVGELEANIRELKAKQE
jgi:hypothetical protein